MPNTVDSHCRVISSPCRSFLHAPSSCYAIPSTHYHSSSTRAHSLNRQLPPKALNLLYPARSCSPPGIPRVLFMFNSPSLYSSPNSRNQHRYSAVEWSEAFSSSDLKESFDAGEHDLDVVSRPAISVRAFFFSTSVDLKGLVEQNKSNFISSTSRTSNYIVLKFGELSTFQDQSSVICGSSCSFMVVFQYGAVVLFNAPDHEAENYLTIVRKHASGLLPEMKKDEYEVRENPDLKTWMQPGLDHLALQFLNIDGIRIIGSVLGQSIALDYYGRQVDGMVAEFTDINREMEKTGTFSMDSKKLFQIVGRANSNLADVILKLGLFERSDIAWKDAKYGQIWEYLRDEFELTQRFASLDFKLKFVEHNIRFFQEILQNRKSDFLEWLIIILISVEIVISVFDLATRSGFKFLKLK